MTAWDDLVSEHPVNALLDALEASLQAVDEKATDVEHVEARERIARVVAHLRGLLDAADPLVVAAPLLDQLASDLTTARTHLDQFSQTEDTAFLANANSSLDAALARLGLGAALGVGGDDGVAAYREALTSFRSSASQHLRYLEGEVEDLGKALAELRSQTASQAGEIDTQKGRLDSAIADYQKQFSSSEAQRAQTFTQRMDEVKSTIDQAIATSNQSLQAELASAKKEVSRARTEAEAQLVSVVADAKGASDDLISEASRRTARWSSS